MHTLYQDCDVTIPENKNNQNNSRKKTIQNMRFSTYLYFIEFVIKHLIHNLIAGARHVIVQTKSLMANVN